MIGKAGSLFGAALVSSTLAALAADAPAVKSASERAFERLTSLAGEWDGVQQGVPVKLKYTVTADGTALMEEMAPAGPAAAASGAMITMYSVDGDHLLGTHYCSAGNQPQMSTGPIKDDTKALAFSLLRVTGLKTPEDFHNTGLVVKVEDPDHLTQEWSYQARGKSGINVFHYTRRK